MNQMCAVSMRIFLEYTTGPGTHIDMFLPILTTKGEGEEEKQKESAHAKLSNTYSAG
ncbi:hypothetical protein KSB_04140 [Ktedonobacter robiniae]|uniref:Uncharacterized protein n=1 Tax=Ktedonobacter robiniae TaxID=2778365 RepID=A0ABQ3UGW4_9CHLR|nr:hypothetical protein KSB_04140 [Ktedonobacter robiniae]